MIPPDNIRPVSAQTAAIAAHRKASESDQSRHGLSHQLTPCAARAFEGSVRHYSRRRADQQFRSNVRTIERKKVTENICG